MTYVDSGMYSMLEYSKSYFLCLGGVFFFFLKECRAGTFKGTFSPLNKETVFIYFVNRMLPG